jgi:Tfp pilus assembly protein PilX
MTPKKTQISLLKQYEQRGCVMNEIITMIVLLSVSCLTLGAAKEATKRMTGGSK